MIDNPEQSQASGREVEISVGLWTPYDEVKVKKTGILGKFITFSTISSPNLITTRVLHKDGTIDETVVNAGTQKVIPQTHNLKRINGRIEIDPRLGLPVLRFTEVPIAKT